MDPSQWHLAEGYRTEEVAEGPLRLLSTASGHRGQDVSAVVPHRHCPGAIALE